MARHTVRKIDKIHAGSPTPWWRMEVPRLATLPAALAVVGVVALFNGAFAKSAPPAPAPVIQTVTHTSPTP